MATFVPDSVPPAAHSPDVVPDSPELCRVSRHPGGAMSAPVPCSVIFLRWEAVSYRHREIARWRNPLPTRTRHRGRRYFGAGRGIGGWGIVRL